MFTVRYGENAVECSAPVKLLTLAEACGKADGRQYVLARVNGTLKELRSEVSADAEVTFVTCEERAGALTVERSLVFMMLLAFREVAGEAFMRRIYVDYSLSNGLYCRLGDGVLSEELLKKAEEKMQELAAADIPFEKESIRTSEAIRRFSADGMEEKAELFRYRRASSTNIYHLGGLQDYYFSYMVPSTGYLKAFRLISYGNGFILQGPAAGAGEIGDYVPRPKLYGTMKESTDWTRSVGIRCIGDLNRKITETGWNDLILMQEAFMEKKIGDIAHLVAESGRKIIMITGPSSSGKTTFSHRLSVQLKALGLRPWPIACDNYYKNRSEYPVDENGKVDLESIDCLDADLINKDFSALLRGETVELPEFNFVTGKREYHGNFMTLGPEDVIVFEGIHCLNDALSWALPEEKKYRIYISALTVLNIDEHNRIPSSDVRLLRRIVRDARTRGVSAAGSIAGWSSVRAGEDKNIFPYQERADVMINSAVLYELSVLKTYAEPLLFGIPTTDPAYEEAKRLLKFLDYVLAIPSEQVPATSLVREFIGGGCFDI